MTGPVPGIDPVPGIGAVAAVEPLAPVDPVVPVMPVEAVGLPGPAEEPAEEPTGGAAVGAPAKDMVPTPCGGTGSRTR